jgi:hypothetical protein
VAAGSVLFLLVAFFGDDFAIGVAAESVHFLPAAFFGSVGYYPSSLLAPYVSLRQYKTFSETWSLVSVGKKETIFKELDYVEVRLKQDERRSIRGIEKHRLQPRKILDSALSARRRVKPSTASKGPPHSRDICPGKSSIQYF